MVMVTQYFEINRFCVAHSCLRLLRELVRLPSLANSLRLVSLSRINDKIISIQDQDLHFLNKDIANV